MMLERMGKRITGRIVLALFVITNGVYALMLAWSLPAVAAYAPGLQLFDMSPGGYDYEQAIRLLTSLGLPGRELYLWVQLPLDFVYPALFAATYTLLVVWAAKKFAIAWSRVGWLALLPLAAGLFDYAENVGIILMLNRYPNVPESMVRTSSFFTVAKSACTTVYFVAVIVGLVLVVIKRLRSHAASSG